MSAARTDHQHPIRASVVHVFEGVGQASGRFVARFFPYDAYPILFTGMSAEEAEGAAEDFRAEVIAKHEAVFAVRAAALAKARAVRQGKKGSV